MNERKFLKAIHQRANQFGEFTPSIVRELLRQERQLQLPKKENIFTKLFGRKKPVKSAKQIIADNIDLILGKTVDAQLVMLLENLMDEDELLEIVKDNFDSIFERFYIPHPIEGHDNSAERVFARNRFLTRFRKLENTDEILIASMDKILQRELSLENIQALKGLSEETDKKLEEKVKDQIIQLAEQMLEDSIPMWDQTEQEKKRMIDDYIPTIVTIIQELLQDEKVKLFDIKRIGVNGAYSKVYKIGTKVLKIGSPRATYQIPNHPRILQPLTRTNLIDENRENEIIGCIEVSDEVDQLTGEEMQEEALYQIYKELRDDGIFWTDVKFSNIGKLKRPNVPKLNGEEMNVDPQAVGMDKENKQKALKAGEWVVLDTDFLYKQEDEKIWIKNSCAYQFEKRWEQERQEVIAKKYRETNEVKTTEQERLEK